MDDVTTTSTLGNGGVSTMGGGRASGDATETIPEVTKPSTVADGISRTDEGVPAMNPTNNGAGGASSSMAQTAVATNQFNYDEDPTPYTQQQQDPHDHGQNLALPRAVYLYAGCAALNSMNLGYDIGVNTDAAQKIQMSLDLTDVQIEIFLGSLNLFAMLGALGSHFASDRLGRRGAFLVAAVGFILGIAIMCIAPNYTVLMFGRVFVGLGVGFGLAVDPVYIAEITPAAHRGRLVTWAEIGTNVGILFGFMSGLFFYNVPPAQAWRGMFALGAIIPSILIVLVCVVMPESPRWLVQKRRDAEAASVLRKIYPPPFDVDVIVKDIKDNIKKDTEAEHAVGWDVILFPSPAFRRMLVVGVGTAIAQQAVGIDAIQYFLVYILEQSNIKSQAAQSGVLILLGVCKLVFIVIAGYLFDRKGRRKLMFWSCVGMFFALLILAFNFMSRNPNGAIATLGLALYLMSFSIGMGPGAWLIPSEVFATTIRAKAMSVATFMNRVTATLMASTFLSTANAISYAGFFLLLSVITVIVGAFFYTMLPETKGRSLEDMSHYFAEITGDQSILEVERRLAEGGGGGNGQLQHPVEGDGQTTAGGSTVLAGVGGGGHPNTASSRTPVSGTLT